jgi:hypothetical protein
VGESDIGCPSCSPFLYDGPNNGNPLVITVGAGGDQVSTYRDFFIDIGIDNTNAITVINEGSYGGGGYLNFTVDISGLPKTDSITSSTPFTFSNGVLTFASTGGTEPFETFTVSSGVPEPATWAMMLVGFAGLGVAAHRRGRKAHWTAALTAA